MPVSESSIIAPGNVDAKPPLKKSTVAWIVGILFGLAVVGYAVPHMMRLNATPEEPTVDKNRSTGTEGQIEEEIRALKRAAAARAAAQANAAAIPAPLPLPPTSAPKSDSTPAASTAQDEMEAGARTSRSVLMDNGGGLLGGTSDESASKDKKSARDAEWDAELGKSMPKREAAQDPTDRVAQLLRAQVSGQAARNSDRDWLKEYAELKPTRAITPMQVKNPFTLIQGKVIPAVLVKSLNSDLPGDITAMTTTDIYDSLVGSNILIPKGSMLIGEYSNRVLPGQSRLMFAFSRIVLPNGLSFDLPGNKGEDQSGASGLTGEVNNHYFKRFTSGILIALLADKLEGRSTQPVTNIGTTGGSNTAAGKVLSEIASADLGRNKDIAPTITIPQGTRINVQVAADMEFPSPYKKRSKL